MRDFRDAKLMTKALKQAFADRNTSISHSEALEIVAGQFGYDQWNILSAKIDAADKPVQKQDGHVGIKPPIPIFRIFDVAKAMEFYCGFLARLCTKLVVISGSAERLGVNQFVAVCVLASSVRSDSNRWMSKFPERSNERGDAVPHILRQWLSPFRFWFTAPSWEHLLVLVMGALLSPGKRTVTACLRITGRAEVTNFAAYHQFLNRSRWNPRLLSARLLSIIVERFVPDGPVVIGMDDTIERRWGQRIAARGIYRDPVRSSHGHFVKASGLRWLSFMVLSPVPWARCIKALPVLTILCPSERHDQKKGRRHKLLTDWARQGVLQLCRWLPEREVIFVGDSSFAVHTLAAALPDTATLITRLRLDASLFAPPDQRHEHTLGRPAQKGRPLPKLKTLLKDPKTKWQRIVASSWYGRQTGKALDVTSGTGLWYRRGTPPRPIRWVLVKDPSGRREPQAFMSTSVNLEPAQIIAYFVRRWQIEVTFAETRAHLGVETQRQWNDKAIMRTTPALLGLYSLVVLWACDLLGPGALPYAAAWYKKTDFTFSDAIGAVRMTLWDQGIYRQYPPDPDIPKFQPSRVRRMTQALCFAA